MIARAFFFFWKTRINLSQAQSDIKYFYLLEVFLADGVSFAFGFCFPIKVAFMRIQSVCIPTVDKMK